MVDELNKRIDENPEVHTAGWIPGHDWTGTVFYPIYLACKKIQLQLRFSSGLSFLLYLWTDQNSGH